MRLFDTQIQQLKCQRHEIGFVFCFLSKITFLPYLEALVSVSVECCP